MNAEVLKVSKEDRIVAIKLTTGEAQRGKASFNTDTTVSTGGGVKMEVCAWGTVCARLCQRERERECVCSGLRVVCCGLCVAGCVLRVWACVLRVVCWVFVTMYLYLSILLRHTQRVVVCCSVLQCVAVCCSVLQ